MAPLRRLRSCFFDDGPRSGIREGDQANMRRKYAIHPSVGKRCPTEFECASDGGAGEVAVYEAYLEAGFRGVIPSLIGEVSSFFVWKVLLIGSFPFPGGTGAVPGTGSVELRSGDLGFPPIARFRHRTRRLNCALKPTGVVILSSFLRQDIALVILRSRVPLRPEPHSEPGGGPVPLFQTGETVEPEALMFPEEELVR
ncbi:hypothetical protein F2Q69_00052724 [Brassica cretica]|uniref:Uncharacterized protein n=1 Tax=Brassica cretica TaxID=69181 RepID=A0A8S9MQK4_BRACR|nr:hypothetical protein F2Q69_00052724 [Brassica cretica]